MSQLVDKNTSFDPLYPDEEHDPLTALLARFTYKPDWKFESYVRYGLLTLIINAFVVDADAPHKKNTISFFFTADLRFMTIGFSWEVWLRQRIIEVEQHEIDEFFQIDGIKPFDPHAGEKRQA